MKEVKLIRKQALYFVAAIMLLMCLLPVVKFMAEAEDTVTLEYNSVEAVVFGEPIDIKAKVTKNGVTTEETIKYTNLSAPKINNLFSSQRVLGYVEGCDEVISQEIFSLPSDLVYLINLGTNQTEIPQGLMASTLLLDHTGKNSGENPFHKAVLRKFPDLYNTLAAKQYGVNKQGSLDYGYTGESPVAKMDTYDRDIYQNMVFNQWNAQLLEVTTDMPDTSEYNVMVGIYNYWSGRPVSIRLNGDLINDMFSIKSQHLLEYKKVTPKNGKITFSLTGTAQYSEPMMSFVAITKSSSEEMPVLSAPVVDESMELDKSAIDVSGLTVGAKLMVYNDETGTLLKEQMNTAATANIGFGEGELSSIYRIRLIQIDKSGAISETSMVQRTDINDLELIYNTAYVSYDLPVTISCSSMSLIQSIRVKLGDVVENIPVETNDLDFEHTLYLSQNGDYVITLFSQRSMTVARLSINNIDNLPAKLDLGMSLASAKKSDNSKIVVDVSRNAVAPTTEFAYLYNNQKTALANNASTIEFTKSGEYTVYFINEINKMASRNIKVALEEAAIQTVKVTRSETRQTGKQVNISFASHNGYEYSSATVYYKSGSNTEKMIVNGSTFAAFNNGTYFVQVNSVDGTSELLILQVQNINKSSKGCGSAGAVNSIFAFSGLLILAAAVKSRLAFGIK